MSTKFYNIILCTICLNCFSAFSQRITLNELQTFCNNKNWETTNKNLLSQKWDYYNSTKGDDEHYDIITWANGRNYNNDTKASAWLYLYNYDNLPSRIMYRFRQKEYYTAIQSQLKSFGYGLTDESIHDEKVVATYENQSFVLKIAYKREVDEDEDNYYANSKKAFTAYEASIYKKGGAYDPNNGHKKEYDEDGNLEFEYFLKNNKLEGVGTRYSPDGKKTAIFNFKNGAKDGKNLKYEYLENSSIYIESVSNYRNGVRNGKFIDFVVTPEEKYISGVWNYRNGVLQGKSFQSRKNIIEESNFVDGHLDGEYKEYLDMKSILYGGLGRIDTLAMPNILILEQHYGNDRLEGFSKRYDITGVKIAEGSFKDSLKTGTWRYYYENLTNGDGSKADGTGELHWIANYKNGMLDGVSESFSESEDVKVNCADNSEKNDECFKRVITRFYVISNFKEDELDGAYEMKSVNGEILVIGNYQKGIREGKWILYSNSRFSDFENEGRSFEVGNYLNNEKEGVWERYDEHNTLLETYFYKNSKIDGKHVTYRGGKPAINRYYYIGNFNKFEIIENGEIKRSVEILAEDTNLYNLLETSYFDEKVELITLKVDKTVGSVIESKDFPFVYGSMLSKFKIKNGLYKLSTKDSKIISTGNYAEDLKQGTWIDNFYNQNVRLTSIYRNGELESEDYWDLKKNELFYGEFIYANSGENLTEERKVKKGKRHGTTRYKDNNDKTIKKESYKEGLLKD